MSLAETLAAHAPVVLATGGLVLGLLFGGIVAATNFCTMGAISDLRTLGDGRRMKAWLLAIAVAIAGTQALAVTGVAAIERSMYLAPNLNWIGNLAGGLLFGVGMVYAGGCASRNIVRLGGGDLRSLVTLMLIGLFGYMAGGGVLGPARAFLERTTSIDLASSRIVTQGLGDIAGAVVPGFAAWGANLTVGVLIAALLAAYCLADRTFRRSPANLAAGLGLGLLVATGWALTGLTFDELADRPLPPVSLTFVRPTGDTLDWLGRFTALGWPGFGVATVIGAVTGSFLVALARGRFRIQTFADRGDTLRNMGGAALMGVGGVMALGCTIGQGLTGLSTLAAGSLLAFIGIVAGAWWALGRLERALA